MVQGFFGVGLLSKERLAVVEDADHGELAFVQAHDGEAHLGADIVRDPVASHVGEVLRLHVRRPDGGFGCHVRVGERSLQDRFQHGLSFIASELAECGVGNSAQCSLAESWEA